MRVYNILKMKSLSVNELVFATSVLNKHKNYAKNR